MPTLLPMFLNNFIKKYPKKTYIEELNTQEIIIKLNNGYCTAIAATPLLEEKIKEIALLRTLHVCIFLKIIIISKGRN
jgi:LysR family hydrogen peroxide-inducible transcriptional activator